MSIWKLGGLTVESGGESSDPGVQKRLNDGTLLFRYGPPPGMWAVDSKSDWSIHQWMLQMAHGAKLVTDYEPSAENMPEEIRSYIDACQKSPGKPGQVF